MEHCECERSLFQAGRQASVAYGASSAAEPKTPSVSVPHSSTLEHCCAWHASYSASELTLLRSAAPHHHPLGMTFNNRFDLTVQLMSGKSIKLRVFPELPIDYVHARIIKSFRLRGAKFHFVHNDQRLIFNFWDMLTDVGIDGPTTLTVVIVGPGWHRR